MPTILFDQAGLPAGTVDEARSDIVAGTPVTVTAGGIVGTAVFGLLNELPGSSAVLTGAGLTRSITPDVVGRYRIRIIDDNDGSEVIHTFAVVTPLRKMEIPAFNERANPDANAVDTDPGTWVNDAESNEGGSFEGWDPAIRKLYLEVENSATLVAGAGHLSGMRIAFGSITSATIAPGACRNDDDDGDIAPTSTLTAVITASGVNGLDTGAEAASTLYSLWAIADSTGVNPVASLLSVSETAPQMPAGYDKKRRVGWVFNNTTSDFTNFVQTGNGRTRRITYDVSSGTAGMRVLTNGASAVFVDVDLSTFVPPTAEYIDLLVQFETGAAGLASADVALRPGGFSDSGGNSATSQSIGVISGQKGKTNVEIACPGQIIQYEVDDAVNNAVHLNINAYDDEI